MKAGDVGYIKKTGQKIIVLEVVKGKDEVVALHATPGMYNPEVYRVSDVVIKSLSNEDL